MILATRPTHHFGPPPFIRLSKARVWTFVDGEVVEDRKRKSSAALKGWETRNTA